ncbi:MAG: helix-turn-helix transcriptional regulator [Bacteroidaceae bacterium]|nr:helix-turn-helix transcriptional regulator [Bacteroidaceae bacterium]
MEENLQEIAERIRNNDCPDIRKNIVFVQDALDVLHGKWTVPILWAMFKGNCRFKDIQRFAPGLSDKILSQKLKQMMEDKLVERVEYQTFPPTVEYHLTEHGVSLYKVLALLMEWGGEHRKLMLEK